MTNIKSPRRQNQSHTAHNHSLHSPMKSTKQHRKSTSSIQHDNDIDTPVDSNNTATAIQSHPRAIGSPDVYQSAAGIPFQHHSAPAPSMIQRSLIFDSLFTVNDTTHQLLHHTTSKSNCQPRTSISSFHSQQSSTIDYYTSRGTYTYTFGASYYSQLGRKVTSKPIKTIQHHSNTNDPNQSRISSSSLSSHIPTVLHLPYSIKSIACGGNHTALVTSQGQVLTFGDDRKGQLGHSIDNQNKHIPLLVEGLQGTRIVQVACGRDHTVALSDTGYVYSWGSSKQGQCGHGDRQTVKTAKRIEHHLCRGVTSSSTSSSSISTSKHHPETHGNDPIVQIACGEKHTICLSRSGGVIAFGGGSQGQTGLGDEDDRLEPEKNMSLLDIPIRYVSCGNSFTVYIARDTHELYISGFGEYFINTLNHENPGHNSTKMNPHHIPTINSNGNTPQHFFYTPTKIFSSQNNPFQQDPPSIVACGHSHILVVTQHTGSVYSWGAGDNGQLGHGVPVHCTTPKCVLDGPVVNTNSEQNHNNSSTAASENSSSSSSKAGIHTASPIVYVAAGRYHSMAVTREGIVYGWGSNSEGSLGIGYDIRANVHHSSSNNISSTPHNNPLSTTTSSSTSTILLPTPIYPLLSTVVGNIACGEYHTVCLTAAPWQSLSTEMKQWYSYEIGLRDAKYKETQALNRGLNLKDLKRIREEYSQQVLLRYTQESEIYEREKQEQMREIHGLLESALVKPDTTMYESNSTNTSTTQPLKVNDINEETNFMVNDTQQSHRSLASPSSTQSNTSFKLPTINTSHSSKSQKKNRLKSPVHQHHSLSLSMISPTHLAAYSATGNNQPQNTSLSPSHHHDDRQKSWHTLQKYHSHSQLPTTHHHNSTSASTHNTRGIHNLPPSSNLPTQLSATLPLPFTRQQFLKETTQILSSMSNTMKEHSESQQIKEIQYLHDLLKQLQREYNIYHAEVIEKQNKIHELKAQINITNRQLYVDQNTVYQQHLYNTLKMQLNTIGIKINETLENRNNYDLNLQLLKDTDLSSAHELSSLRAQEQQITNLYKKLHERRIHAHQEKQQAEQQLQIFQEEITSYISFLKYQFQQFQNIAQIQQQKKQKHQDQQAKKHTHISQQKQEKIQNLEDEVDTIYRESQGLQEKLYTIELRLQHFEKKFHKIYSVTGLTNPDEIINRYIFKSEITQNLQNEIDIKQQHIDTLKAKKQVYKNELDDRKQQYQPVTWKDIEGEQEKVRVREEVMKQRYQQLERVQGQILVVQEALYTLYQRLRQQPDEQNDVNELMELNTENELWKNEEIYNIIQEVKTQLAKLHILHNRNLADIQAANQRQSVINVISIMSRQNSKPKSALQELEVTLKRYDTISREFEEKMRVSRTATTASNTNLHSVRESEVTQDDFQSDEEKENEKIENHGNRKKISSNNINKNLSADKTDEDTKRTLSREERKELQHSTEWPHGLQSTVV